MQVLRGFVSETFEHGVAILFAKLEELVRQRIRLIGPYVTLQLAS
jgi:hypothetical protein